MSTNPETARVDALKFLKSHKTGVLASLSPEGAPHARLLYYVCDDAFNVYFVTLANTRKVEDIMRDPRVAFTVAAEEVPQTVQIEGTVEDVSNMAVPDSIVHDIFEQLKSNAQYHAPLTRFDSGIVHFFRIAPNWIRWGNFTEGISSNEVFFEIAP